MLRSLVTVLLVFGLTACGESPEKAAEKATDRVNQGNALAEEGLKEYMEGIEGAQALEKACPKLSTCEMERLNAVEAKFVSSRQKLASARISFSDALSKVDKSSGVKMTNRESVEKLIANIDVLLVSIDEKLAILENVKSRINKGQKI